MSNPNRYCETLRQRILKRDGFKCLSCGATEHLLIHHLSYDLFSNRDVPLKFLITLCNACHGRIPRPNHPFPLEKKENPKTPKPKIVWETSELAQMLTIRTPDLISFAGAARLLKVSRPTVYNLIERLQLHPVLIARNRYLLRAEVERIVNDKPAKLEGRGNARA